jgi:predicted regulator of Ras-like GTPase activity (Roadblock/LC7/MglB family)
VKIGCPCSIKGYLQVSQPDHARLGSAFTHLVQVIPGELKWVTLVTVDGLFVATYPEQADSKQIAALTANLDALSERISSEVGNGPNRYTIISGVNGLYLLLVIPGYYFIAMNFTRLQSLDALLNKLHEALKPLSEVLGFQINN